MSADLPKVAGYRVERPLGEGGMAEVYLATQLSLNRKVALKVLSAAACRDEGQAQRFEREARLIAALEHPHIVGIFEVGRTADGRPFYAMPLMPGGDLGTAGLTGQEAAVIDVLDKILSALEYAHACGIVHRDVKPANVLFDAFGQPRLADFGIARPQTHEAARLTVAGIAVGSPYYMAPEQARGDAVDGRADLYSVGVMAYELLTGELPFRGPDSLAVALQHLTAPVPRLPGRFRHWQAFIDRAMAKRPEERFANAAEMRAALAALRAKAEASPVRPFRWRSLAPRAAIGSLVALLFLGGWWWLLREERPTNPDFLANPELPTADASPQAEGERSAIEDPLAPLLARARQRMGEGALAPPNETSAAALVLAVLRAAPQHPEAHGLLEEIEQALLLGSERALRSGATDELRAFLTQSEEYAAMRGEDGIVFRNRLRDRLAAIASALPSDSPNWQALRALGLAVAERKSPPSPAPSSEAQKAPPEANQALPPGFVRVGADLRYRGFRSRQNGALVALARPVSRRDFALFIEATGHKTARCRGQGPLTFVRAPSFRDPGFPQGPDDPAVCIAYTDAEAYARWLTSRLGKRVRLPRADELQHLALHQFASRNEPLTVREWTLDCVDPGGDCRRRTVLDPGLDGRRWPLHGQALDSHRGHTDVGFRLVLD